MANKENKKSEQPVHNKKEAMLAALEKTMGIVTKACKLTGVGRTTHYDWMRDDKEYKKKVEELENVALDFAESKLMKNIDSGDTTATIFYLKTKGKKRGYGDQMGIDLKVHEMPKNVNIGLKVHKREE